ncbi:hypothetical protein F2Q70_00019921 [Brassica cretica]|uniref:PGG domain-containing protein n=1 Tax=Brassica cretica TaxID=69181 RepID=A0A8S9GN30_BRACR|nr:hypothetical protein F2Q70_00019921 [Brassica cretica]
MDPRLEQAAESGSIDQLYALIEENPYILENMDAVPFVTTPLHIAAASGNTPFAKEIMNLKPSFARKLNTSGYSPLHLAVDKDKTKFVARMLWLDEGLARVKGRNGITPFLSLVSRGKAHLVAECLLTSPECIQDETVDSQNALHLAVIHDRFEVLQVLTGWIQRMSQRNADSIEYRVLNESDLNSSTPLHLAASKNDHQASTYQTALQPPGGVHQSDDANAGSVVMKQTFFILLWVFNTLGFCCAILYTFFLIPLGSLFVNWFFWIGTSLCISYALAMAVISPHPLVFISAAFAFFLLIALYILLEVFIQHWRNHRSVDPKPRLSWFWKV